MNAMNKLGRLRWALLAVGLAAGGCLKIEHKVDPIKIEPIYATFDINLKIDRQLDDFFAFEHQPAAPTTAPAAPHAEISPASDGPQVNGG